MRRFRPIKLSPSSFNEGFQRLCAYAVLFGAAASALAPIIISMLWR